MKVVIGILVVVVLAFLGAVLYASMQSPDFAVGRSTVIHAPADSLYARLATPRTWARWSAWNARADSTLRYAYTGPDAGPGATMSFTSRRMGNGSMRIAEVVPGREVRYELGLTGTEMVVHGRVTLEPVAEGTRVTWRDTGSMGRSLFMRLLKPLLDRAMAEAYETSFAGLKQDLGAN